MKLSALFVGLLAATTLAAPVANATVLAVIGQVGITDPVTATVAGGVTTITSSTLVDITAIDAPIMTPVTATLDFTTSSVGPAITLGGDIVQAYMGSFSITSGAINYLSGTFTDSVFGSGTSLVLTASSASPGETVTFTSNEIPASALGSGFGVSFAFTDVHPAASTVGVGALRTLAPFTSDISGDFSATPVPEPSTWVMLALGFAGLGYAAVRRSAKDKAALAI
jgi:hypothetical protein